ncbi:unnamed protein product [Moneuplotes crassus]|uniref:histidine kinase n=1 Tax=Euplotes crassus TaxID=5936 RepID=A0AAD1Y8K7_EUPCR|nr:unnamed protein product [Moneuplotes crassus]
MYQEHRVKMLRTNWSFILLVLKAMILIISICLQFNYEYASAYERITLFLVLILLFVLKHFIYKNNTVANYGAVIIIILTGSVITSVNIEFTQFRVYEAFLFHLSVSFLLSTCVVSNWRVSCAALLLVYANLYVMLRIYFDSVPITVLFALGSSLTVFGISGFLISRNLKQEFLSTFIAQQASSQLKKILEGLPEGVTIMNEQGDELKFINQKLKKTFDLSLFYQAQKQSIQLTKMKEEIDEAFKKVYSNISTGALNSKDSQTLSDEIFSNFMTKLTKEKIEEGKGNDPDVQVKHCEQVPLPLFLQNERQLCHNEKYYERSTKVSISYTNKHLCRKVEYLDRDFVIKTSKISMADSFDKFPTFLHMFIDTTQITQLEEAKAQNNYQRQMFSNVSHEFRTPLNAMSLSLHLMEPYIKKELVKYHKISSSSCGILGSLVEDIMDLSKIEAGVFEIQESVFTFKQLFDEVQSIFEMQAHMKKISLNFQMEDVFLQLEVKSDKQRLKQILLNLVSNSLKFTDRGSINVDLHIQEQKRINREIDESYDLAEALPPEFIDEISVCNLLFGSDNYQFKPKLSKLDQKVIDPPCGDKTTGRILQREGDESIPSKFTKELKVELSVTDTGIGIPKKDLPCLFKLFGKSRSNHNRNQTGTGLGLTICKKLCEKLGGKISLKSKEGVGTKITCSFICYY